MPIAPAYNPQLRTHSPQLTDYRAYLIADMSEPNLVTFLTKSPDFC